MSLAPYTRLGRYEIRSPLGAGGMGEVYAAEDASLERRVALKVLPPALAGDAERMARFVREAKAASALNHPHIAHVYEIGEAAGVNFIAMELVEGVSLREKIHGERADLKSLLKYLTQVAEGLAKAHAAGIVHRDLKPDNVMVSADGYAKILDFGLAKLVEPRRPANGAGQMSEAATAMLPQPLSTPGVIMGTAGYMSPEQAQGRRELDHRSDIFSFGCVLYEAATRRQPFAAETWVDSLHKIIHAQPAPIRELNADAPADLQRIVRRCLQKDPEERYQTIKDVAIELRELRREMVGAARAEFSNSPQDSAAATRAPMTEAVSADAAGPTVGQAALSTSDAVHPTGEVKKRRARTAALVALMALLLAGTGYGAYRWATAASAEPPLSFQSAKFTRLTTTGKVIGVNLSPDGRYVAHVIDDGGQQSLWVRQTAAPSDVHIVPPAAGASYRGFTFSPDGNFVYYTVSERDDRRGTLYQVPVLGGASRKLLSGINSGVTFSPDGRQIAFFRRAYNAGGREDSLLVANADGTGERTLAKTEREVRLFRGPSFSSPAWSPDGRTIACPYGNSAENYSAVAAVSVETGEVRPLTTQRWFAVRQVEWLAGGGRLLFTAQEHSAGAPYQIWQLTPATGEARRVSNDLINYRMFSLTAGSDVMAVVSGEAESNTWVMPANDSARAAQVTSGKSFYSQLTWTPDGEIIYSNSVGGGVDLYLTDPRGGGAKQLTADSRSNGYPQATRDGRHVVFMSDRTGRPNIWRMDSDGGNQRRLTDGVIDLHPHLSPDGRWVVYQSWVGNNTLRKVSVDGGQFVQLTDYISGTPAFSPDGRLIACSTLEDPGSTLQKIAVVAAEGGPPLKTFPLPGEGQTDSNVLRWTADGREIVYAYTAGGVSNLWAQPVDGGKPRQITSFTSDRIFWFDFSHDGKQIALARGALTGDVVLIKDFR